MLKWQQLIYRTESIEDREGVFFQSNQKKCALITFDRQKLIIQLRAIQFERNGGKRGQPVTRNQYINLFGALSLF
jgi:hypothetical protein